MNTLLHYVVFSQMLNDVFELIILIVVFILILFATYYTTRWIGRNGANIQSSDNLEVIETYRLSQTKYLQIVRTGKNKYIVIAVTKDNVSFISEIDKEDIDFSRYNKKNNKSTDFSEVLKKLIKKKN